MSSTLKAEHYTQGEAFVAEKQQLFARSWLPLGAAAQLAAPGDFVSATVGGWPILAVRGADGVVRALMNSCRHKNMPVVDAAHGHCEHFRCRFHGWTYSLDGHFRDAPLPVAPADPASPACHLTPLRTEIVNGMVFVNLDASAASPGHAALFGGDLPHYFGTVTADISCNWKALLEHVLTNEPATIWHSPLLLAQPLDAAYVVKQVVPRSFLRTRLVSHVYGDSGADRDTALQRASATAAAWQSASEALQAARAGGAPLESRNARVAALHESVLAAYAAAGA